MLEDASRGRRARARVSYSLECAYVSGKSTLQLGGRIVAGPTKVEVNTMPTNQDHRMNDSIVDVDR